MTDAPCRHVWVTTTDGGRHPGLVVAWRKSDRGWEAYVAVAQDGAVLVSWCPVAEVHPVRDARAAR